MRRLVNLVFLAILSGCVQQPVLPSGASEAEVVARMGRPVAEYALPAGKELEYGGGPWSQRAWMVRFDADGRMASMDQVRTVQAFAAIRNGASKDDVLRAVGRPSETSHVYQGNFEVWSYRYKENEVWNSMMHLHFDGSGRMRMALNGPDPDFDGRRSNR